MIMLNLKDTYQKDWTQTEIATKDNFQEVNGEECLPFLNVITEMNKTLES